MFCENCGSQIPDGSAICPACGTAARLDLAGAQPVAPVAPVQPVAPAQPVVPVQPVVPEQPVAPVYQQPAYQQPVYQTAAAPSGSKVPAILALILGIVGLAIGWIPYVCFFAILASIAGLVMGIIALKNPNGKGMGITGFVLSIVGIVLCLIMSYYTIRHITYISRTTRILNGYKTNLSSISRSISRSLSRKRASSNWDFAVSEDKLFVNGYVVTID